MGEVLEFEVAGAPADMDPEKRNDIEEVLNYRRAMRQAVEELGELPLCIRLIKRIHETLLSGVRGDDKGRGRFRTIQNYIGVAGRPVEQARFIPIPPEELVPAIGLWEKYLHQPFDDALVQLAIVHAEFESLHPFLDGNGRIGRILVPLYLYERKLLHAPMFYLSEFLEANRREYFDRLLAISRYDDWTGWCRFFLEAIQKQSLENDSKARKMLDLYQHRKDWIAEITRSQYGVRAMDWFFSQPIFKTSDFVESSKIPKPTAHRILGIVKQNGLFTTLRPASGRRPAILAFTELLNTAEGREVF